MTKRTLLEGEYIPGLAYYDVVNVIDNTSGCVAITTGYNVSFAPDSGAALPTEPIQFLHIEMTIENAAAVAGLSFEAGLMEDQQYFSDNAAIFAPVVAEDTDNTPLSSADDASAIDELELVTIRIRSRSGRSSS